jgi:hypothetical protein
VSGEEQRGQASDDRARTAFGPFQTLTVLTELQAEGIRRASDIAGRLIDLLDSGSTSPPRPSESGRSNGDAQPSVGDLRGAMGRLIDVYGDVLQRTFDAYADLLDDRSRASTHLDGGPTGPVRVEIDATADPLVGNGELWLGNGTDTPSAELRLVPTPLVGVTGCVASGAVMFQPDLVEPVAAGASVRVTVSIEIDRDVLPGYYHGYVLVPQLPGEALPLTLVVTSPHRDDRAP